MYREPSVIRVIVTTACLCYFRLSLWNISLVVADTTLKPISCSFENEDSPLCQWQQASNDMFEWTRHYGLTQTANTGPQYGDKTTGSSSGHYLYTEVSSKENWSNARIISPVIDPFDSSCAMTFYYNMFGTGIGILRVYIVPWEDGIYGNESKVFEMSGSQGTDWHEKTVTFGITYKFQVIIEGVRTTSHIGDIAIDDTSFSNTCEKFDHGSLRLVPQPGTDVNQGRLDIYLNGVWGSICNRNFDTATDGVVACIQLGYRKASSSIYMVSDTTLPILDNVQCHGNETGLLDCKNDGIGVIDASCNANRVVNIWCSDIIDICEDVGPDAFHCDNVHCIPSSEKCDFSNNCGDQSDEASSICDVYPGRANFQFDFGEWSQPETNGVDWSRSNGLQGSGGPSKDHKDQIDEYYLVVAGSNVGKKAQLCLDMSFEANPTNCSIRFYYYRNFKDTGTIDVIQRTSSPEEIWSIPSNYEFSSQWNYAEFWITSTESFHICFEATLFTLGSGSLGLDDISLTPGCVVGTGECELTGPTFICDDGLCIHEEYVCDHVHHCLDASDENSTLCEDRVGYCTFQDSFCDWQQVSSDNLDWTRLQGDTPTSNSGPSVDHTLENHFGYYVYLEVSSKTTGHYADLVSPWLTVNDTCKLRIFYHIYGNNVGNLKIGTMTRASGFSSLFTEGSNRDEWRGSTVNAGLNVQPSTEFQFVIRATVGNGNAGDIAIDDLSLSEGCIQVPGTTTIPLPVSTHEPLSDVSTTVPLLMSTTKSRSMTISSKSTTTVEHLPVATKSTTTIPLPVSTNEPFSDVSSTAPLLISTPNSRSTTFPSKSTTSGTTTIPLPVSSHEPSSTQEQPVPRMTTPQQTTKTSKTCGLEIRQTNPSCSNGYEETCSVDKRIISVKDWGEKECSWKITADEHYIISLIVKGMTLLDSNNLTVADGVDGKPERIKNEDWKSKTSSIQIFLSIGSSRLKRDTQVASVLELEIQTQLFEAPDNGSSKTNIGPIFGIITVIALLIVLGLTAGIFWRKKSVAFHRQLPVPPNVYYQPDPPPEYTPPGCDIQEDNPIYHIPKQPMGDNAFVDLPADRRLINQNSKISGNDYQYHTGQQPQYMHTILRPESDYLIPAASPPPLYDEICPRPNDNYVYHGGNLNTADKEESLDGKLFQFLKDINLHKYEKVFKREFVVFDDIPYIEAEELTDMGLDKKEVNRFLRRAKQYAKKTKPRPQSAPGSDADDVTVPSHLLCPLSRRVMKQPVIAADNNTYDFENINEYLKQNNKSPVTGEPMEKTLSPNVEVADQLQKFQMKREGEQRRKRRKMQREKSDLTVTESRPVTPMTDVQCI